MFDVTGSRLNVARERMRSDVSRCSMAVGGFCEQCCVGFACKRSESNVLVFPKLICVCFVCIYM
jgi:hypothetical protein